jgi:hypothetical protein
MTDLVRHYLAGVIACLGQQVREALFHRRQCSGKSGLLLPEEIAYVGAVLRCPLGFREWYLAHRCHSGHQG